MVVSIFLPIFAAYKQDDMPKKLLSSTTKKKLYVKGSDFCLDLAKLVFAGVILAGVMDLKLDENLLFLTGTIVLVILIITGVALFIKGNQKQ